MQKLKIIVSLAALSTLVLGGIALGATLPSDQGGVAVQPINQTINLQATLDNLTSWGFGLLIALASVFILIAAYYYLTSAGSEDNLKKAKDLIIYALVAILIGFAAKGLVAIVGSFLR